MWIIRPHLQPIFLAPKQNFAVIDPESMHPVLVEEGLPTSGEILRGKRIALAGRIGGMNRREAKNLLESYGATISHTNDAELDWIVIGADEPPLAETELLGPSIRNAASRGELEVLSETELWQRVGLVEQDYTARKLYTPAMLSHLLGVSIRVIRRWHRLGLIRPVQSVHKLPYFDFQQVASARRLAGWIASGANPRTIESRLAELVGIFPNVARPLDQLSILVEGKEVLLRQDGGLLDLGGQLRFDFDSMDAGFDQHNGVADDQPSVLRFHDPSAGVSEPSVDDDLLHAAYDAEDRDDLETAIDFYHAILARDGPNAGVCFQIGELLYRVGEVRAARERFFMATELDPEYVEARATLGDVLAETGQVDLAIAAYRGALTLHPDYAEVHLRLARTLDRELRREEAREHWQSFVNLTPESPLADEGRRRLSED